MRRHLEDQLGAAYPQARCGRWTAARFPGLDPARLGDDEQVAACALVLRRPPYLPLRTFADAQVDPERAAQADPVLGLLGAAGGLPEGWRSLPSSSCARRPTTGAGLTCAWRSSTRSRPSGRPGGRDASLRPRRVRRRGAGRGVLAYQGHQWYAAGDWLHLAGLGLGVAAGAPALIWLVRRLGRRELHDPRLVQEKIGRPAYLVQPRLAVFAPADAPREAGRGLPEPAGRAPTGSTAWRPGTASSRGPSPRGDATCARSGRCRRPATCRSSTPASWPDSGTSAAPAPTCRSWSGRPPASACRCPARSAAGCRIGVSVHQGRAVPVALPERAAAPPPAPGRQDAARQVVAAAAPGRAPDGRARAGGRTRALVAGRPAPRPGRAALGCVPPDAARRRRLPRRRRTRRGPSA